MSVISRAHPRRFEGNAATLFAVAIALLIGPAAAGCGNDSSGDSKPNCGIGKEYNKLTGECEDNSRSTPEDTGPSTDTAPPSADTDGVSDTPTDTGVDPDTGTRDLGPDVDTTCSPNFDPDNDGLTNECECKQRTNPNKADTDGDGLDDREELGGDCSFDPEDGDTNPLRADTDEDGLDDKTEVEGPTDPLDNDTDDDEIPDGIEAMTCTDPTDSDTDGDGLPDGVEDANQDGQIGTCPNRMYDPSCAQGESDPCSKDTDGDGTPDSDEAKYRECLPEDKQNLMKPNLITNQSGNYKLATESSITSSPVSASNGTLEAHVYEDPNHDYTGFVLRYDPGGTTDPAVLGGEIASKVQSLYTKPNSSQTYANRRSTGRQLTTHDGYDSVVGAILDIPNYSDSNNSIPAPQPHVARDDILAKLAGTNTSNLSHNLTSTFQNDPNNPTLFVYEVVSRSSSEAIVVGAVTTFSSYKDDTAETGFRVDDLTGGAALATPSETLTPDCVSFDIDSVPKVDVVIALDASGSMQEEQNQLSNFAAEFTNLLSQGNVDWRVGVTSVACSDIKNDTALRKAYRDLWPTSGSFTDPAPCTQSFGGFTGTTNGTLVGGNFTTDPSKISQRLSQVNETNSEYALTMGAAAVDRALPRKKGSPTHIREDASVIVVAVTDEMDQFFQYELPNGFGTKTSLTASEQSKVDAATKPWIQYLQRQQVQATAFGLFWPPGEQCNSAAQVAHGIADIVNDTGGNGGSVCQTNVSSTLRTIANAAAGLSSGLRLLGVPVGPSIQVKHADVSQGSSGTIDLVPRSRDEGFTYDPIVNRISFVGPDPPETGDRLVVPYMRWKNSIEQCKKKKDSCPNKQVCVSGVCR